MKRDMELIREILVAVEADAHRDGHAIVNFDLPGRNQDELRYHAKLLRDAGWIRAEFFFGGEFVILDLTNQGHDFLDAVRNETVWKRLKKKLGTEGETLPLEVIKLLAIQLLKELLGLK